MAHEDFFLKLDAERGGVIKGEAQDREHKDEIDVVGWSWGMSAPTSAAGNRKARATIHQLCVRKRIDSASTALMAAVAQNGKLKTAVLTARRAGGGQIDFLRVTLRNAFLTSIEVAADGGEQGTGTLEDLKISFETIKVEYVPQGPDGAKRGSTSFEATWAAAGD
ncbi:MAG TPA: type VI secretion system tube protein Hcp [Burkholderiaceae bacterium]|nr:type VI secretion system tube protein Hcp [Burkholderiaceae bacterium]